eukprot:XP_795869.3 PREDICTED: protein FAM204A [Strongylocentrotus purpuratus]
MLSILGGILEDEISSGSSDDSDHSSSKPNQQDPKLDNKNDACKSGLCARDPVPSQQFSSPRVPADNSSSKPVNAGKAAESALAGDMTRFRLKFDHLQKFQKLQEQRIQAEEEKVPEGYKRRRRRRKRRHEHQEGEGDDHGCDPSKRQQTDLHGTDPSTSQPEGGPPRKNSEHLDTLNEYLDVNSHISQGVDHGHLAPDKSGLEKRLDEAIAEGDFEKAEKLSEDLSVRDLGCRIAKAANARDYMKWKAEREEEKAAKKRKKKKKLAWGFEIKNRWEMKANM